MGGLAEGGAATLTLTLTLTVPVPLELPHPGSVEARPAMTLLG